MSYLSQHLGVDINLGMILSLSLTTFLKGFVVHPPKPEIKRFCSLRSHLTNQVQTFSFILEYSLFYPTFRIVSFPVFVFKISYWPPPTRMILRKMPAPFFLEFLRSLRFPSLPKSSWRPHLHPKLNSH